MALEFIDVVTTATLRPELLELTYRSFHNRLFTKFQHRSLIINIDPLPGTSESRLEAMLAVCREWFPEVVYRHPESPSFPAAVQWAWSQVESEYCFHLEDDWLLLKSIDPMRVYNYFSESPHLAEVTLNPSRNRPGTPGLALRPSFIRRSFIAAALPLFESTRDPEKQWRSQLAEGGPLESWRFRHYGEAGDGRYIRDMSAAWRKAHSFDKWDAGSVSWRANPISSGLEKMYRLKFFLYAAFWSGMAGRGK